MRGAVARFQTSRRRRIAPRELGMQRLDPVAALGRARTPSRTATGIGGTADRPARQRLEVKAGAADEDRQAALRARLRQHDCGIGDPVPGGEVHGAVDMAVEPVRRLRLLLPGSAAR